MYSAHAAIIRWKYHHDSGPTSSSSPPSGAEEEAPVSRALVSELPESRPMRASFELVALTAVEAIEMAATSRPTARSEGLSEVRPARGLHSASGCEARAE